VKEHEPKMASRGGPTKAGGRERGLQKWQVSLAVQGSSGVVRLIVGSLILECLGVFEDYGERMRKNIEELTRWLGGDFQWIVLRIRTRCAPCTRSE
jgi:hypothetical protein